MLALDDSRAATGAPRQGCCPGCTDALCGGRHCHDRLKLSRTTFRRECLNVTENEVGLWGDCPSCHSTLLLREDSAMSHRHRMLAFRAEIAFRAAGATDGGAGDSGGGYWGCAMVHQGRRHWLIAAEWLPGGAGARGEETWLWTCSHVTEDCDCTDETEPTTWPTPEAAVEAALAGPMNQNVP